MIGLALSVVGVIVAQATLVELLGFGGIRPDLYLLLVVLWGLRLSPERATLLGFVLGLYQDVFSGVLLGMRALTLSLLGFAVARLTEEVQTTDAAHQMILCFFAGILSGLFTLTLLTFFGLGGGFGGVFLWVILPEAAYTTALAGLVVGLTRTRVLLEVRL